MIWQISDDEKIYLPYPCSNGCDTLQCVRSMTLAPSPSSQHLLNWYVDVALIADRSRPIDIVLCLPRPPNRVRKCLCKVRRFNYCRVDLTRRSRSFSISWRQSVYI